MNRSEDQSGNVLFLILIAVVLFAAVAYAISANERQTGENLGRETARIAASQIIQHGVALEGAVMRMRVGENMGDTDISFETPFMSGYANPSCTQDECRVFAPSGGQVAYAPPNPDWLNTSFSAQKHFGSWLITGTTCIPGVGKGSDATCGASPEDLEIVAFLPWLTRDICLELDRRLGISLDNGNPPKATGSAWAAAGEEFTGTYGSGQTLIDATNFLFFKPEGCFEGNGTPPAGSFHYYRVLFPR
jgi:hypothetical protein